jgi:DNA-directed RNA polymerase subunit M/transcription elongation factor TFIIS
MHRRKNISVENHATSSAIDTAEMDVEELAYFEQFEQKTNQRHQKRLDAVQSNDRGADLEMCIFCKKHGAWFRTSQDRSGDESASYHYTCTFCAKSWCIR